MIFKDQIKLDMDGAAVEEMHKAAFDRAKAALKAEIQNDPMKRGYKGKTEKQIADLMNKEIFEPEYQPSRIIHIWAGIPYAKNAVEAIDIKEALKK